ncbi:hypothetical protein EJD97_006581 [Solanum chilense]|uniref:Ubiquitin-like protease family profile domain-containing protein n=1 Tax=Solanum chilense TaxID=4083 RepID=A0A6N2BSR2_SOLCI|nr:hypothetical protein EJD97_006581 [Solanum chilense]
MPYLITLELVETISDPVADRVKMVLAGATTIKRKRVFNEVSNELVVFYADDGVDVDYGTGVSAAAAAAGARQHKGATSCRRCCGFLYEKCKKHDEDSIMYLQKLSEVVNEFKNKRGVKVIISKNVRHACTPKVKQRKESFDKAMQNLKRKMFREIPRVVMEEEVKEYKRLNIYRRPFVAEKEAVIKVTGYIDEIINLMRQRHWKYPDYYNSRDRILDLNFCMNFLRRYNQMSDEATMSGDKSMSQLLDDFLWDDDMIDYVRGIWPTPGGMDWIDAKRILTVMNILGNHFVTVEILLHGGLINVYDCNLVVTENDKFFTLIQPVFELLPKLLKQSGIMNHFPEKLLTQPWELNGRIEAMVQNASGAACGSYSIAFIEHLISRTELHPPSSTLCDNLIERMQYIWANGIISQCLKP